MNVRSNPIHLVFVSTLAVLAVGCHKPNQIYEPGVPRGRVDGVTEAIATSQMPASQTSATQRPAGSQELSNLNAELRAQYAEQLDAMLKQVEQSYLKDKDGWMEQKPLRQEEVRTIWNTNPK